MTIHKLMLYLENTPEKKKELLEKHYYSHFQMFDTSHIVYKIINNAVALGMILEDFDVIDAHVFIELSDALANRYTVEDVYIGFSLWRLSGEKKHIKSTLRAADNFVIQYMYPFADMPGARNILYPITTGKIYERLAVISSKYMVSSVAAEIVYTKASQSGVWNEELYANETDDNRIIQRTVSCYSLLIELLDLTIVVYLSCTIWHWKNLLISKEFYYLGLIEKVERYM